MLSPEVRTDVLTGRQVIIAAARAARPVHVAVSAFSEAPDDDPFLEGHEHNTPHERLALRTTQSQADKPGWLLRVVPNLYPAVAERQMANGEWGTGNSHDEAFPVAAAGGIHEVVIECPDHRTRLAELSVVDVARTFLAWQMRLKQAHANATLTRLQAVSVFRNEGTKAGASLPHCHSQILATDFVGSQLAEHVSRFQTFATESNGCLFDHWLQAELRAEQRIVRHTEQLMVVCPFASRVPWQTRFCPTGRMSARFEDIGEDGLLELAATVHGVVRSLDQCAGTMPHNLTLTLPPLFQPDAFPWILDLLPRPNRIAGFELLTDVDINTTAPEVAAEEIRQHANWCDTATFDACELSPSGYSWR